MPKVVDWVKDTESQSYKFHVELVDVSSLGNYPFRSIINWF